MIFTFYLITFKCPACVCSPKSSQRHELQQLQYHYIYTCSCTATHSGCHTSVCVSSPTPHSLQSQLSVEIWSKERGGQRRSLLHLTQSDVGSAVSTQNDLQNKDDQELHYPQIIVLSVVSQSRQLSNGKHCEFSTDKITKNDELLKVLGKPSCKQKLVFGHQLLLLQTEKKHLKVRLTLWQ